MGNGSGGTSIGRVYFDLGINADGLNNAINSISNNISTQLTSSFRTAFQGCESQLSNIGNILNQFSGTMQGSMGQLSQSLAGVIQNSTQQLGESLQGATQQLSDNINQASQSVGGLSDNFVTAGNGANQFQRSAENVSNSLTSSFINFHRNSRNGRR